MSSLHIFISTIFIIILICGGIMAMRYDQKKFTSNRDAVLARLGMKLNVTYKLTNKYNGIVYFIRINHIWENNIISFICNTHTKNIGLFKNSLAYILHIIEECDIEEGREWLPEPEPKI